MKEIKVLPKNKRNEFFRADTKDWRFGVSELSDSGIETLNAFIKKTKIKPSEIFRIPEVNYPEGVKAPDLLIGKVRVEIKNISSRRSIEEQTTKASKQSLGGGMILYNTQNSKLSASEILSEIEKRAYQRGIFGFFVSRGSKDMALKVKSKNDSATSSYAGIDSESFRNLILPQNPSKINTKSAEYWRKRSLQRTTEAEKLALPYLRRLKEEYARSSNRSIDNVRRIYENYLGKAGFDRQKLREIVPNGEFSKFLREVRKLGVELPDNYAFRVSREEFAQAQLWLEMKKLGVFENKISNELYSSVIENSMKQTFGDYGVNFSKINTNTMNRILNAKFYGENFKTRIEKRADKFADELPAKLALAIAKGQSWEKTSREIRNRFGVSQYEAERLIRTETNYFENSAEIEVYNELGVEYFEFLAALDGRTSEICRHHHGKKYKVEKAKAGENVPPLHPNCRSTVVAVIPELERVKVGADKPKDEKPRTVAMATKNKSPSVAYYTGKIIGNRDDLRAFAGELMEIKTKTAKSLFNLVSSKNKNAPIVKLNKKEQHYYGLKENSRLIMKESNFRHLLNSGHITGVGKNGKTDKNPLTPQDLLNIKDVFKSPDFKDKIETFNGKTRFKLEKQIDQNHRLILELEKDKNQLQIITFFNTNKKRR